MGRLESPPKLSQLHMPLAIARQYVSICYNYRVAIGVLSMSKPQIENFFVAFLISYVLSVLIMINLSA